MIKVIRNMFRDCASIHTRDGTAKWEHVKRLHEIQSEGQLHLANKLTKRHINYDNNIMKVKYATQLFSQSVADALQTLKDSGIYPEFRDAGPTINFLKVCQQKRLSPQRCASPKHSNNTRYKLEHLNRPRQMGGIEEKS